jgi:hypothetical protein
MSSTRPLRPPLSGGSLQARFARIIGVAFSTVCGNAPPARAVQPSPMGIPYGQGGPAAELL